jgi:hypothetical protein
MLTVLRTGVEVKAGRLSAETGVGAAGECPPFR